MQPLHVWHGHLHRRTDAVIYPAAWGGACEIHGLAADEMAWDEAIADVGCDGAPLPEDGTVA